MKSKKTKIWKTVGASLGIAALLCAIPTCIVSCGSSNNSNNTQNSSSTTPINNSATSVTSNSKNISNLFQTSVNNNAKQLSWLNTNLNIAISGSNLSNIISVWQLPTNSTTYSIMMNHTNCSAFQWYQIPFSVFFSQITNYLANNSTQSVENLLNLIVQNSIPITNATSSSYNVNYDAILSDAFYICKAKNNGQSYYSQITWLQEPTLLNPNGVNSYSVTYQYNQNNYDTYNYQSTKNEETIVSPWNTSLSFSSSVTGTNEDSTKWSNYFIVWQAGNYYSDVMNMDDPSSFQYSFNCTSQTTNVGILIFNSNGQLIKTNETGIKYTINVINPLKINDCTYSLSTSSQTTPVSYNNKTYNDVVANNNSSIEFTLSINGLTNKSFAKYDYEVIYSLLQPSNYESDNNETAFQSNPMDLSNVNSWKYSFTSIPSGIWDVEVSIIGPTKNSVPLKSNSNYQIVNSYVKIAATNSNTSYGQSNTLSVKYGACIWNEVTYEWESSSNKGNSWTVLATSTVSNSPYLNLATISSYSVQGSYKNEEFRLVVSNASGIYSTIISNVITLTQNLLTPIINFKNSTYQTQYNSYKMAFVSTATNTFNLNLTFSQYGSNIGVKSSELNGLNLTVYAYQGNNSSIDYIDEDVNLSSFYNATTNSITIPISTSNLISNYQTEYYGDGNNPIQSPIQLNVSLLENNQWIESNTLQVQYLSISYTGNNSAGNGIGTVTINSNQQNPTPYSSFDSSLDNYYETLYYAWQKSLNGTEWSNVSSMTYEALTTNVITQNVYYRLIVYASKNEQEYTSSNVIQFQCY